MEPIRVLLADDHTLFRKGMRTLLDRMGGVAVVGEAATGQEAVDQAQELVPDVILMDIQMPAISGIEATRQILHQNPHVGVILVTMIDAPTHTFNGCSLSGCVVATSLSTEDQVNASLDAIFQVTVAVAVETTLDPLVTEIATPQFDIEVTQETTDSDDTLVGGTSGPRNDEIGGERDDEICTGVSTGGPGDMTNDRDC